MWNLREIDFNQLRKFPQRGCGLERASAYALSSFGTFEKVHLIKIIKKPILIYCIIFIRIFQVYFAKKYYFYANGQKTISFCEVIRHKL